MAQGNNDHPTCVYHALHGTKTVKASEATKLFKQGWRDSPYPKTLYSGVRGKWYLLIISYRSFIKRIAPHWDSHKLLMAFIAIIALFVTLFIHLDSKEIASNPKSIEQTN